MVYVYARRLRCCQELGASSVFAYRSEQCHVYTLLSQFYSYVKSYAAGAPHYATGSIGAMGKAMLAKTDYIPIGRADAHYWQLGLCVQIETFAKRLFLPPALFANAHLLLNKLRFAA